VGICCTECRGGTLNIYKWQPRADVILFSGKTSLIHSLAGELGLDIYVVSLSSKGFVFGSFPSFNRLISGYRMSDNTLATLMGNVPSR